MKAISRNRIHQPTMRARDFNLFVIGKYNYAIAQDGLSQMVMGMQVLNKKEM